VPSAEFDNLVTLLSAGRITPATPIDVARSGYEAVGTMIPMVEGTTVDPLPLDHPVDGLWVRAPGVTTDRVVLWLHGGGYVIGSPTSHRPMASRLSAASGASVLLVDYRLAPEHPYPAAVHDATAAYEQLLTDGLEPGCVAIGGDSAGGGLAITTSLVLRDRGHPLPAAIACASPWVDLSLSGASMATNHETDLILSRDLLAHWAAAYLGPTPATDPAVAPLAADGHHLPPLLVHAARDELLADDAVRLVEWARRSGADATLVIDDDMIHHWHVWAGLFPEADQAVNDLGAWLGERLT
jgi:monoterpene epsilon-lactone hydrolase